MTSVLTDKAAVVTWWCTTYMIVNTWSRFTFRVRRYNREDSLLCLYHAAFSLSSDAVLLPVVLLSVFYYLVEPWLEKVNKLKNSVICSLTSFNITDVFKTAEVIHTASVQWLLFQCWIHFNQKQTWGNTMSVDSALGKAFVCCISV